LPAGLRALGDDDSALDTLLIFMYLNIEELE
jgi:hypothetical protein